MCQSAISGMLRNMSLLNTSKPGLLPKVVCTPDLIACEAIYNALSIRSFTAIAVIGDPLVIGYVGCYLRFGAFFRILNL